MSGVKQITNDRKVKNITNQKISKYYDNAESLLIDDSCDEDDFSIEEIRKINDNEVVPTVLNKAKDSSLNLAAQYARKVAHCQRRELFRIHDFSRRGDKGARDKSNVYIEFQGGLFEAIKQNFVNILKDKFDTVLGKKAPQVETYGKEKAEER